MSGLDEECFPTPSQPPTQPPSGSSVSRRRAQSAKQPAKGVSLGLEDEVEFGSDEDLMETVGENEVLSSGGWYPGKPDSPPLQSRKSKAKVRELGRLPTSNARNNALPASGSKASLSSVSTGKSRPSILGRSKEKKGRGIGDAKLVLPEDFDPTELGLTISNNGGHGRHGGHSRQVSDGSMASSKMTGSSLSLGTTSKKGEKRGMFGRMFGKKRDEEMLNVGSVRGLESTESFGSGSRFSDACEYLLSMIYLTRRVLTISICTKEYHDHLGALSSRAHAHIAFFHRS